jgi:putative ABC transport system permease protein
VRVYGDCYAQRSWFDNVVTLAVDPSFFQVFGYSLAQGYPAAAPNTAVLTHETAIKLFGHGNPLGKTIRHNQLGNLTVTGVLTEHAPHTHLFFDVLVSTSFETPLFQQRLTNWQQYEAGYTYVLLKPETHLQTLKTALTQLAHRHSSKWARTAATEAGYTFRIQPLNSISPAKEGLRNGTDEPGRLELLIELGVGLLTLLLAGFNYINLTLARATNRAREVGIRKVAGARRWQLIGQLTIEAMILSLSALGIAYLMMLVISPMPSIQQYFIGGVRQDVTLWLIFILFSLTVGFIAGLIPARILSGVDVVTVLRSATGLKIIRGVSMRKALIVSQFTLTLIAVIFIMTMLRQQQFMARADYGFRREGVLLVPVSEGKGQRLSANLSRQAGVQSVANVSHRLGGTGGFIYTSVRLRKSASDSVRMSLMSVDAGFLPTMNLTLLAGQNLPESVVDSVGQFVVINEKAAHQLGFVDARIAVGQRFWLDDRQELTIIGVIKDFNHSSLAQRLEPLILRYQPAAFRYLCIAVTPGQETAMQAKTEAIFRQIDPQQSFAGQWYTSYLEERHARSNDTNVLLVLIGLALCIACLGLFGMVTYQTEIRTREVGVRKVLGASATQIVALLARDFVNLLLVAAMIALPIGYLYSRLVLANFAYHVEVGFETLGTCLLLLMVVGGLTIGWRTYLAAQANPVKSLRTE